MTDETAIQIVAREVLFRCAYYGASADWEDYPELREGDWGRVEAAIERLASAMRPSLDQYAAAYALLAGGGEAGGTGGVDSERMAAGPVPSLPIAPDQRPSPL